MTTRWVATVSVAGLLLAGCGGGTKTKTVTSPSTASSATQATTGPSGAPTTSGAAAAGKAVFISAGCGSCHTLAAAGTTAIVGPNLDTRLRADCATPASKRIRGATLQQCIYTAITNPFAYLPSGYRAGIMPAGYGGMPAAQIKELVTFLSTATK
jgi:cytochrome c551/c552